ncbi:unnamed protein product [Mytilus edulis]|uniref:Uncharacterized protein n=1 Tax=Mytilus edulis TaxID=6550 RepID=A0A8S3QUJ5_MYTED|nr:unnamed protein product [Mytilus edulis]
MKLQYCNSFRKSSFIIRNIGPLIAFEIALLHVDVYNFAPGIARDTEVHIPTNFWRIDELRSAVSASIQDEDPANPWIKDASGRHTNVTAMLDWPDSYDSDTDVTTIIKRHEESQAEEVVDETNGFIKSFRNVKNIVPTGTRNSVRSTHIYTIKMTMNRDSVLIGAQTPEESEDKKLKYIVTTPDDRRSTESNIDFGEDHKAKNFSTKPKITNTIANNTRELLPKTSNICWSNLSRQRKQSNHDRQYMELELADQASGGHAEDLSIKPTQENQNDFDLQLSLKQFMNELTLHGCEELKINPQKIKNTKQGRQQI